MPVEVTEAVAFFAENYLNRVLRVVWHGGEPLASGVSHMRGLVSPLARGSLRPRIKHNIQTNGTLIDEEWCDFFEEYGFNIGVSIDGPENLNGGRKNLAKLPSYARAMKGIKLLRERKIPFSIISVVSQDRLGFAPEIYRFAQGIGAASLCINLEEKEGINQRGLDDSQQVRDFWKSLYDSWRKDPSIRVREFERLSRDMVRVCNNADSIGSLLRPIDIFPSISSSGDIYLLSPEFLDVPSDEKYGFVVGNILNEPLNEVLERGRISPYVVDFLRGVQRCASECPYYVVCGGGQASNKYFEHKNINTTATDYCRSTKIALTDAVLGSL